MSKPALEMSSAARVSKARRRPGCWSAPRPINVWPILAQSETRVDKSKGMHRIGGTAQLQRHQQTKAFKGSSHGQWHAACCWRRRHVSLPSSWRLAHLRRAPPFLSDSSLPDRGQSRQRHNAKLELGSGDSGVSPILRARTSNETRRASSTPTGSSAGRAEGPQRGS